jgi:diaminohydroxyphosphoribosylaminopyrimidine deaminase/5-amino-6-(5-phosphoribosylamino)uracil reductase
MTSEDSFRGYKNILKNLYSMGITSILVEGGAYIFSKFYQYNLLDDIYVFISPKIIGEGISSFENFKISNLESNSKLKFINLKIKDNDIVAYLKKIK